MLSRSGLLAGAGGGSWHLVGDGREAGTIEMADQGWASPVSPVLLAHPFSPFLPPWEGHLSE